MRYQFLSILLAVFLLGSGAVQAEPKWAAYGGWDLGFGDMNRANHDFSPYLDDIKNTHPVFNENRDWQPEHWISQLKDGDYEFIYRAYKAGLIHDQDIRKKIPTLIVGPAFYQLSSYDQHRFLRTVDYVYGMSEAAPFVMFVRDWKSDRVLGTVDEQYITLQ